MTSDRRLSGKRVVVTGACGTVGSELVFQLLNSEAEQIICLDNNESDLFYLLEQHKSTGRVACFLADIRDFDAMKSRLRNADIVLHAAALKHVGLCEDSPDQAVRTNIIGTQNVIEASVANEVERVVFTSSDKAVNPTSVMGTSKLMGERLMTAANQNYNSSSTVFSSTRFGNVLGSRGSVLPLFRRQILAGGPVTLTDEQMTRFIMSLEEAARLVLDSIWLAVGGEVMVTKMHVARIKDIATTMISHAPGNRAIEITHIGTKPGEKLYEELMNEEEVRRTYELGDFFVILPAFAKPMTPEYSHLQGNMRPDRPYNSMFESAMSEAEVARYLTTKRLLDFG